MAVKRSSKQAFIDATIKCVAEGGLENLRTKQVAESAGFSEATLFKTFESKEALLEEAFLYVDKSLSDMMTQSVYFKSEDVPFELALYTTWRKVYRRLLDRKEETIFLIRFRYSSLYTLGLRGRREAYNGGFDEVNKSLSGFMDVENSPYDGFLVSYIFEMTLCFAEKIVSGKIADTEQTEYRLWAAINAAAKELLNAPQAPEE